MPCSNFKSTFFSNIIPLSIPFLLILLIKTSPISAKGFHDIQQIQQAVESYLHQQNLSDDIKTTILPIDSRLKLKQCSADLALNFKANHRRAGRHFVKVACLGKVRWKIYVSVIFEISQLVAIAAQPILAGEALNKHNVRFEKRTIKPHQAYFSNLDQLNHKLAKRSLSTGDIIAPRTLKTQYLIKKGDSVTIVAETDSISVRMQGTAQTSGNLGDNIRLKNKKSGRLVEGIIISEKVVRIY